MITCILKNKLEQEKVIKISLPYLDASINKYTLSNLDLTSSIVCVCVCVCLVCVCVCVCVCVGVCVWCV